MGLEKSFGSTGDKLANPLATNLLQNYVFQATNNISA